MSALGGLLRIAGPSLERTFSIDQHDGTHNHAIPVFNAN